MRPTEPIDVNPVEHSSDRSSTANAPSESASRYYTYGPDAAVGGSAVGGASATTYRAPRYGTARAGGPAPQAAGRVGGAVQLVAGSAIALVGVPMLILPGPGLLAIGGGIALAAGGAKKLFGK